MSVYFWLLWIIEVIVLVLTYFVLIRPISKRKKQEKMQNMRENSNNVPVEQSPVSDFVSGEADNSKKTLCDGGSDFPKKIFCQYCGQSLSQLSEVYCENCGNKIS